MKRMGKNFLMITLCTILLFGLVCTVQAKDKTITGLGTGSISNPEKGNWNKVYFGSKGDPIMFNVLQINESHFGGNTLLLDCASVLEQKPFDENSGHTNDWSKCTLKDWLNGDFLNDRFTDPETAAIAESNKKEAAEGYDGDGKMEYNKGSLTFAPLTGEKVFVLDAKEVTNTSYGFENSTKSTLLFKKMGNDNYPWWLRSAYDKDSHAVSFITYHEDSGVNECFIEPLQVYDDETGVSPALNIKMDSVMFSSKTSDDSYKLTFNNPNMTIEVGMATRDAKKMTIPYTIGGADKDKINRVSVVMTDAKWDEENGTWKSGRLKYYGEVDETGSFTLPDNYDNPWNIYLVAEQVNDGNVTDYASTPAKVTKIACTIEEDKDLQGGTIKADKEKAELGDEVTVTVTPEGSRSPDKIIVKRANDGTEIRVLEPTFDGSVYKATFSMPACPVIVTATFGGSSDEASESLNSSLDVTWKGSNIILKYGAVSGATSYEIHAAYAGKSFKKIATVNKAKKYTIKKLNKKKLNKKKTVKIFVVAKKGNMQLGNSIEAYVAGPNNTYTNAQKIKISKTSYTLKNGKTKKLNPKLVLQNKKKKILPNKYAPKFRYAINDKKVATVSKNGKIKAKGKGTCKIYIFAANGKARKVTLKVK